MAVAELQRTDGYRPPQLAFDSYFQSTGYPEPTTPTFLLPNSAVVSFKDQFRLGREGRERLLLEYDVKKSLGLGPDISLISVVPKRRSGAATTYDAYIPAPTKDAADFADARGGKLHTGLKGEAQIKLTVTLVGSYNPIDLSKLSAEQRSRQEAVFAEFDETTDLTKLDWLRDIEAA
ncbi:hypothetical protein HYS93_00755 [Candidatus Daviesbacteria bacterium]|nr:hypothetical protein [Candidatus Daviesbacteria bacterium]